MKKAASLFFILSCLSVGVVQVKIYPLFFLVFIFSLSDYKISGRIFYSVCAFFCLSLVAIILNYHKAFDFTTFLKFIICSIFFVCGSSYILNLSKEKAIKIMIIISVIFITISFFQIVFIVFKNDLWLLPFELKDSTTSYIINDHPIFFGASNKNIWASKISIFFIMLTCCKYFSKKMNNFNYVF